MGKPRLKPCPIHRKKPDVAGCIDCVVVRCTAPVVCLEYGDPWENNAIRGWNDLVNTVTRWKKGDAPVQDNPNETPPRKP